MIRISSVAFPAWDARAIQWIIPAVIVAAAAVFWIAGLRLFLESHLSPARKAGWTVFLALVGIGIGILLPLSGIWSRFLLAIAVLPLLGAADVFLFRSGRSLSFWVRACGFEICTVFGAASAARFLIDLAA